MKAPSETGFREMHNHPNPRFIEEYEHVDQYLEPSHPNPKRRRREHYLACLMQNTPGASRMTASKRSDILVVNGEWAEQQSMSECG